MFKVAAVLLAAAASAFAAPNCNATPVGGSVYFTDMVRVNFGPVPAQAGQTVSATLVDLKTCKPFVDIFPTKFSKISGTVDDGHIVWDDTTPTHLFGETSNTTTVSFVAGVSSGLPDLSFSASAIFTPGSLEFWEMVTKGVGVVFTVA